MLPTGNGRAAPAPEAGAAVLLRRFAVFDADGNGVWQRADCELLTRRLCAALGHGTGSAVCQAVAAYQFQGGRSRCLGCRPRAPRLTGGVLGEAVTPDPIAAPGGWR